MSVIFLLKKQKNKQKQSEQGLWYMYYLCSQQIQSEYLYIIWNIIIYFIKILNTMGGQNLARSRILSFKPGSSGFL